MYIGQMYRFSFCICSVEEYTESKNRRSGQRKTAMQTVGGQ